MVQFDEWIEHDLNPFVTFNAHGKIYYTNIEAQFFLNQISSKVLFDLALQYTPKTYGIANHFVNITLGNYRFYALSVGYRDDEFVSIKLYKSTGTKKEIFVKTNEQIHNIFTLLDVAIATQTLKSKTVCTKNYDPSIPPFRICAKDFLRLMSLAIESFEKNPFKITLKLKIGESIKIDQKKYQIVLIDLQGTKEIRVSNEIDHLANICGCFIEVKKQAIQISLPLTL